jgi:hypothetical protein
MIKRVLPLTALLGCAIALAQPAPQEMKSENGVRYACGGVGFDESTAMQEEARKHGQLLSFAARDGSYLANVHVVVAGPGGKTLVETDCDGPLMLLDLPGKGRYSVTAKYGDRAMTRSLAVGGKPGARTEFVWPAADNGGNGNGENNSGGQGNAR